MVAVTFTLKCIAPSDQNLGSWKCSRLEANPKRPTKIGESYPCTKTMWFSIVSSEEVSLLHNAQELFLVHLTITIAVCFINHFLKLFISHPLPKLLCHALQI